MQNKEEDIQRLQQLQQFLNPQHLDVPPTYIATTATNLENMKAKKDNTGLSLYSTKGMNTNPTPLPFVMKLGGRGQDGFAGFFGDAEDNSDQFLIKVDDPATCILEGTAKFAQDLMLPTNRSAVNFAHAGVLKTTDPDKTHIISVQDRVSADDGKSIKAWDEVVYGKKRDPKTLVSKEYFNQGNIKKNIELMSKKAQWDLANAIFASTLVGDESLHVGQFMAEVDNETNQVTGITRIDLGARERYAFERSKKSDFKHQTSQLYKNSGQKGKDYISYLLNSPEVKQKYLSLWSREMDIHAAARNHKQLFLEEMNKLPEQEQDIALDDIIKTMFKKSKENIDDKLGLDLADKKEYVGTLLKATTIERMTSMQKSAREELLSGIVKEFSAVNLKPSKRYKAILTDLICQSNNETAGKLKLVNKYLTKKIGMIKPEQAGHFQKIAQTLIERQRLAKHEDISEEDKLAIKTELKGMKLINIRLKMIDNLSKYHTHLKGKSKNVSGKTEQVELALKMLQETDSQTGKFVYEPKEVFDMKFDKIVSMHRVQKNAEKLSKGGELVKSLQEMTEEYKEVKQLNVEPLIEQDIIEEQDNHRSSVSI